MYHKDLYNFNNLPKSYWHSTDHKHENFNLKVGIVDAGLIGWGIEPNKDWLESSNYQYFDGK